MASDSQSRTAATAMLRAVADLIQTRPDIQLPGIDVDFYLHGPDAPATITAIAGALPCGWRAEISRSGGYEWLNLANDPPPASVTRGAGVRISAPTADTCTPAGAKTVTVWRPAAALAGLIGDMPVGEVTR
ncbi:MAG TPA: hypothetical protein VGM53_31850 [Streptosporangiaceae bacterium]